MEDPRVEKLASELESSRKMLTALRDESRQRCSWEWRSRRICRTGVKDGRVVITDADFRPLS